MTGLWLISYIVLWVLVAVLCFLAVGLLQQVGFLQRSLGKAMAKEERGSQRESSSKGDMLPLEDDGPLVGSSLPELTLETFNNFGVLALEKLRTEFGTLLVFLSPLCEGCQDAVEPLNEIVGNGTYQGRIIVVLRGSEPTCQSFLKLLPLHVPVVSDHSRTITMSFDVHRNPFALLYDQDGILVRKGVVRNREMLLGLLGNPTSSPEVASNIFPPTMPSHA